MTTRAGPLVLASSSRYRKALLSRLDLDFETEEPEYDERADDHLFATLGPEKLSLHVAEGKARSIRRRRPDAWILSADQIAVLDGPVPELLHKPDNLAAATDQLMRLSGRIHRLITGVVLDGPAGEGSKTVDVQKLTMRAYQRAEAETYVQRYAPMDCVGSYRVEDAGLRLMERIEGDDYTGIIGLPLLAVCRLLRTHEILD